MKQYVIFYWDNTGKVKRERRWFGSPEFAIDYGVGNFGFCVVAESGKVIYPNE